MVFITACCRKLSRALVPALLALALLLATSARAAEIEVSDPQFTQTDDGFAVSADFSLELNSRLEEVVSRGVTLYFVLEFELIRARWYWFDERLVTRSQSVRLSYHALTRQYRVSTGGLHQSYPSLSEALRVLSRVHNWVVIDKSFDRNSEKFPKPGEALQGSIRMRLDITQLPKPFQIAAVGSRDWSLASDWKTWPVQIPAGEAR